MIVRMKYLFFIVLSCLSVYTLRSQELSLKGAWQVSLDAPGGPAHAIQLPGTLDDAGIGTPLQVAPSLDIAALAHLTRKVEFIGKAYYTRTFTVPAGWQSKRITLTLGRVLWRSSVWVDGKALPESRESLVTAH